jgi:GNAT superfamily N-acetyltransferase
MDAASAGMAADVLLRAAMPADGDDVAALLGELGYPCDHREAVARIAAVAADPRQALLVAVERGRVRALLALHTMYSLARGAEVVRITALVVAGDARGQGLGRRLLREAERFARTCGAQRLEISSGTQRTGAHAFYRECGFAESGLRFVRPLGD